MSDPVRMYGSLNGWSRRRSEEARLKAWRQARLDEENTRRQKHDRRTRYEHLRWKIASFNVDHRKRREMIEAHHLTDDVVALRAQARKWGVTLMQARMMAERGAALVAADQAEATDYANAYDRILGQQSP